MTEGFHSKVCFAASYWLQMFRPADLEAMMHTQMSRFAKDGACRRFVQEELDFAQRSAGGNTALVDR